MNPAFFSLPFSEKSLEKALTIYRKWYIIKTVKGTTQMTGQQEETKMLDTLAKMYAITKKSLIQEYGEQFTGMTEEAQAATVAKVLSDLVKVDPAIASVLAERYIEEVA